MLSEIERNEAAAHVLKIMGSSSPIVKKLCDEILGEYRWSTSPPAESGLYWHWNGDSDCCAVPLNVGKSLPCGTTFVMRGQYGIAESVDCSRYGGWWKQLDDPELPDRDSVITWMDSQGSVSE